MNILSYSPSVEVYAAIHSGGSTRYVDLSEDVVSATVNRAQDASSTFNVTLQNKGGKYNGFFGCFDGIVIYATKTSRVKLLTGYITTFDAFKLYQTNMTLSGFCTLYRIQQLFWDSGLLASQQLMRVDPGDSASMFDRGASDIASKLLTRVAGWPADCIMFEETIPSEVIDWAREMYEAQAEDTSQFVSMVDEFYAALRTHGPSVSGGTSTSLSSGGMVLSGDEKKASEDQKKIVSTALSGTVPGKSGMCLGWVNQVYQAAGFLSGLLCSEGAVDVWRGRASAASYSSDLSKIPLGACMVGSGSGNAGALYGHIGIYVGGGQVISEVGGQVTESVESFYAWQTSTCDGYTGAMGWVCPGDCGIDWR